MLRRLLPLLAALAGTALAQEPYRPLFHFTPKVNWTNDPNGLVYFEGEYHLFFQYNPFGDRWGHMSWGHAVSRDLLHWQELPVALAEENGIMIFTGSTVVDERNTSGFCTGGKPCLVAIYTGHTPKTATAPGLQTQNLAYSNDRGRTWTKYLSNPVIDLQLTDFRDPHVFWSTAGKRWVMSVALPNDHKVLFYGSADLKKWERLSEFGPAGATGGQWECPTLAQLPIVGSQEQRFVLKVGLNPGALQGGSGEQYFVGTFDGTRFVSEQTSTLWTDSGKDNYCALVFNGKVPQPVMLGWMSNWQYAGLTPTAPWRGQMTLPRQIALRKTPEGLRLLQSPVTSLNQLRGPRHHGQGPTAKVVTSSSFELQSSIALGPNTHAGWRLLAGSDGTYTAVGYDAARSELYVDRTHSGLTNFSPQFPARTAVKLAGPQVLDLRIIVDRSSVEVFAQGGLIALTNLVYPTAGATTLEFFGAPAQVTYDWWPLKP